MRPAVLCFVGAGLHVLYVAYIVVADGLPLDALSQVLVGLVASMLLFLGLSVLVPGYLLLKEHPAGPWAAIGVGGLLTLGVFTMFAGIPTLVAGIWAASQR